MKKEEDINNETEQKNIGAPVDKESDDKKKKNKYPQAMYKKIHTCGWLNVLYYFSQNYIIFVSIELLFASRRRLAAASNRRAPEHLASFSYADVREKRQMWFYWTHILSVPEETGMI